MEKEELLDKVLAMLSGDMDDMEGSAAMKHSQEDCPDPLGCTMHESENAEPLAGKGEAPLGVEIEVKKMGVPSLDGDSASDDSKAEDGLSPEEAEELRKLLK